MAKVIDIPPDELLAWLAERPEKIRAMATQWPPDRLYRMGTGHRVTIRSYGEDGTVVVDVSGQWNLVMFERQVFGIDPHELVECDLPPPDEVVGALLTSQKDIKREIARMRRSRRRQVH